MELEPGMQKIRKEFDMEEKITYSENAINVFKKLYYKKDKDGKHVEDEPDQVFDRVARYIAGDSRDPNTWYKRFYNMMSEGYFRPNTPCLMNAGVQEKPQTSACFVSGMQDDLLSILDMDREAAIIFASGSGIGVNFGVLRERGAALSSGGQSSGPFAFLKKLASTGEAVKSGGRSRRAAIMAMFFDDHPDLLEFITLKNGTDQELRSMNLSVAVSDAFMEAVKNDEEWHLFGVSDGQMKSKHKAKYIFNLIAENAHKTGDPGIWFIDKSNEDNGLVKTFGRMISTNPCVTGESLVAVADGREYVPIKQLAEEGNDVLVHSVNPITRKPSIKMGRNPRLTRKNAKILKITFDDNSFLRVTENHKFLDYDGNDVEARDLIPGQQLLSFIKFQNPNTTTGKMYWNIINRDGVNRVQIPEHQLVLEYDREKPGKGYVPHHIDGNSLNNSPNNLEWITIAKHNKIEPSIYSGGTEENPMFGKHHSEETKAKIGAKAKERFKDSEYRKNHSERVKEWYRKNPSPVKGIKRVDRIKAVCFICGKITEMTNAEYNNRKSGKTGNYHCSKKCANEDVKSQGLMRKNIYSEEAILELGKKFVLEHGKFPTFSAWDKWSKGNSSICSREVIRKRFGGIPNFNKELEKIVNVSNHKVLSVQEDGFEDVYNVTVDDFHTLAYITNIDAKTRKKGYPKQWGVYTRNCGEIPLLNHGCCALASINLGKFVEGSFFNFEKFNEIVRYGTYFLDFMLDKSGFPTEDYERMAKQTRQIGLGIMGLADMLCLMDIPYDSQDAHKLCFDIARLLTRNSIKASIDLAEEYGSFPAFTKNREGMVQVCEKFGVFLKPDQGLRNSSWTTIAPTGTISISCDCSPGMEPLFGITYTKKISDSDEEWVFVNSIFQEKYRHEDWYEEAVERITLNHGSCQGIACVPENVQKVWKTAHDIKWQDRIEMQAALQKGISNAISSTINLPKTATVDEIKDIYMTAWVKGLKGITVYRDGSLESQPVQFDKEEKKVDVSECRPKIRAGFTHEVVTGHGKIYVTVNRDESGRILEIFTNGGKNGGVSAANLEAIARLASLALQKGVGVDAIAHTLLGISDGTCVWDKLSVKDVRPAQIISIPDAIGQVLYRFYVKEDMVTKVEPVGCQQETSCEQPEELRCPDCGMPAQFMEGCLYCPHCGSKCG